jgi:hypothetical protein
MSTTPTRSEERINERSDQGRKTTRPFTSFTEIQGLPFLALVILLPSRSSTVAQIGSLTKLSLTRQTNDPKLKRTEMKEDEFERESKKQALTSIDEKYPNQDPFWEF